MLCSRFVIGLLAASILCLTQFMSEASAKSITLNKTLITDFFKGVSIELNKPIVVSNSAGQYRISGEIDLNDPYKAIQEIANNTNLIWYDDASAIYVYSSSELRNEFITVETQKDFNQLVKFLKLSKLYSNDYPLRYTKGAIFVSGPPMYVNVIQDAVTAFYNGKAADERAKEAKPKEAKPEPVEVIKLFPLRNRFVADMRYYIRGTEKTVDGALTILKRLINERNDGVKHLSIVADTLNNSLYVKGKARDVDELKKLINKIDIIREQIQLSLWIIDVDSSELKEVGTTLEGKITSDLFSIGLNGGSVILNQSETVSFVGAVNSLETQRKAKVLSRPVLITQNNTPAVIDTNETIYVRLIGNEEVSLKEITYGTILSVTPRVVANSKGNDIEMMVEIEDGNQTANLIDGLPNIRRSVISTVGRINDSQSLLLGGFVRKQVTTQKRGIPILKDIPIIKYLFSMDIENTSSIMRLFMIEPKIIQDPVAEFSRSKIMGIQSEPFVGEEMDNPKETVVKDPMTGKWLTPEQTEEKEAKEEKEVDEMSENEDDIADEQSDFSSLEFDEQNTEINNEENSLEENNKQPTKTRSSPPFKRRIYQPKRQNLRRYESQRPNMRRKGDIINQNPSQGKTNNVQPQSLDIIDRSLINSNRKNVRVSKE